MASGDAGQILDELGRMKRVLDEILKRVKRLEDEVNNLPRQ